MSAEHDKRLKDFAEWFKTQSVDSADLSFIFNKQEPENINPKEILRDDEIKKIENGEAIAEHDLQILACVARAYAGTIDQKPTDSLVRSNILLEYMTWARLEKIIHLAPSATHYWFDQVVGRILQEIEPQK